MLLLYNAFLNENGLDRESEIDEGRRKKDGVDMDLSQTETINRHVGLPLS